jgi:formate hydrogenlyase subunit 3/multisubunit Na+/H+ antiporter MnhD subunit
MIPSEAIISPLLLAAAIGLPLAIGLGLMIRKWQPLLIRTAPWTALPALGAVVWMAADGAYPVPWLLLEARLGIDPTGRLFLMFTSVLWFLSGLYAQGYLASDNRRGRFFIFFQLSMAGNFGLILSQDVVSFYVFFALMSFASYGLVVHTGDAAALRAGRVYIYLVVVGELLIFTAFLLLANSADSLLLADFRNTRPEDITVVLLLVGFGIKAGALPLHVWLPLAHPAAPTPASAVLSGAMIKAGLLGWIRFLPLGVTAMPEWGALCIVAGLAAAYYAVVVGIPQQNPKTVLAYSSISQMGLITVGVGLSLGWPKIAPVALPAVSIYAIHHGLAKGVLFLGVGAASATRGHGAARRLVSAGVALAALSLAGAPFTSGLLAKITLKQPLSMLDTNWVAGISILLVLAAVGTTFLMARFLFLLTHKTAPHGRLLPAMWLPWTALILLSGTVVWFLPETQKSVSKAMQASSMWQALWPLAAGTVISAVVWIGAIRKKWHFPVSIPEGDLIGIISPAGQIPDKTGSADAPLHEDLPDRTVGGWIPHVDRRRIQTSVESIERRLLNWQTAGFLFILLIGLLFLGSGIL